jgi:hypothetical protein
LSGDFFCSEEAATRPSRATHGMFVARFMEIRLSLLGKAVDLLNTCASDAAFEDAIVLLCVYIKGFIIDRWLRLGCMGRR